MPCCCLYSYTVCTIIPPRSTAALLIYPTCPISSVPHFFLFSLLFYLLSSPFEKSSHGSDRLLLRRLGRIIPFPLTSSFLIPLRSTIVSKSSLSALCCVSCCPLAKWIYSSTYSGRSTAPLSFSPCPLSIHPYIDYIYYLS